MVRLYLHHRCVRSTIEERERERIIERVIENSRPRTGAPHGPRARDGEVVTARLWRARQRAVVAVFAEVATALGRNFRLTTRGDGLAERTACTVALHRHVTACTDVRSDVAHMCLSRARAQATYTPARARARPDLTDAPARRIGARCFFCFCRHVCVCRHVSWRGRGTRGCRSRSRAGGSSRARASVFVDVARRLIYVFRADGPRRGARFWWDNRARTWHGWMARTVAREGRARARSGSAGARAWSRLGVATTRRAVVARVARRRAADRR